MSATIQNDTLAVLDSPNYPASVTNELVGLVPDSWTSAEAKARGGTFQVLMAAIGQVMGFCRGLIDSLRLQLRVKTATNNGLDVIATDFFGTSAAGSLPRLAVPQTTGGTTTGYVLEMDTSYRARIEAELLRERGTVRGIINAVAALTGAPPDIFEPFNPQGVACWGGRDVNGVDYNGINTGYASGTPNTPGVAPPALIAWDFHFDTALGGGGTFQLPTTVSKTFPSTISTIAVTSTAGLLALGTSYNLYMPTATPNQTLVASQVTPSTAQTAGFVPILPHLSVLPAPGDAVTFGWNSGVNLPSVGSALGWGGLAIYYTIFININKNPNGASLAAITATVERVRPAGVKAVVTLSPS